MPLDCFRSSQIKIVILLQADHHKNDHFLINQSFHFHNTYKFIWKFSKKNPQNFKFELISEYFRRNTYEHHNFS